MVLNEFGKIVDKKINEFKIYKNVEIDIYCIMPNHVHLIGEYIKRLKSLTTYIYIKNVKNNNWSSFEKRLWQRNYFENIIRNEYQLNRIRKYIRNNPENWDNDRNNSGLDFYLYYIL